MSHPNKYQKQNSSRKRVLYVEDESDGYAQPVVKTNNAAAAGDVEFFGDFGKLFNSHQFSDCCVMAGATRIYVHRALLSLRTRYFAGTVYYFDRIDAAAIWRVLSWCYTKDYHDTLTSPHLQPPILYGVHDDLPPYINIRVFRLAATLSIPSLQSTALERQRAFLQYDWARLYALERMNPGSALHWFPAFFQYVYSCVGPGSPMRAMHVEFAKAHRLVLLRVPEFSRFISAGGEFALDFARCLADAVGDGS